MSDLQDKNKRRQTPASINDHDNFEIDFDGFPLYEDDAEPVVPQTTKNIEKAKRATVPAQTTKNMEPVKRTRSARPSSAAYSHRSVSTSSDPKPVRRSVTSESAAPVKKRSARPATAMPSKTVQRSARPSSYDSQKRSARSASVQASASQSSRRRNASSAVSGRYILRLVVLFLVLLLSAAVLTLSIKFLSRSIHPAQKQVEQEVSSVQDSELSADKENAASEETDIADVQEPTKDLIEAEAAPASASTSITISLCGDCTLGNEESFAYSTSLGAYYDEFGPTYFFKNVKDIFEADDLTIANLECSFTEATIRGEHTYCFKAPASYTDILLDGSIEAVNLANNHTYDFLEQGYNDTRAALDAASIPHFGYEETTVLDVKGIKVGLVGTYEIIEGTGIETQLKANIDKVKEEGAQIVIVVFHWGDELDLAPNYNQLYLAHKAVDFGADLVCGGHAHVLQGIEEYKGKNILYGMANFCFGGNVYPHDMDTIIYQQTFTVDENGLVDDLVTNIIPCITSSVSDYNNYQPTVATGDDAQRIMNKLNERSASLPAFNGY